MTKIKSKADPVTRPVKGRQADADPAPVEGGYRCTECGHGLKLWAYAGANIAGPLAANGAELTEYHYIDEWGIHTDSIDCGTHPGAVIEMFIDGKWCRWWRCPRCDGGGRYKYDNGRYSAECERETPFPGDRPCGFKGQTTVHEGWLPAAEHEAATTRAAA